MNGWGGNRNGPGFLIKGSVVHAVFIHPKTHPLSTPLTTNNTVLVGPVDRALNTNTAIAL